MSPRLSRGEFWLLCELVRHMLPLYYLGLPEYSESAGHGSTIDETFNRCGHGLDATALARTLHRMACRDWIAFAHTRPNPGLDLRGPSRSWLAKELAGPGPFRNFATVRLRPKGGMVWEQFARPEWRNFVEDLYEYDDALPAGLWRHEVTALDEEHLRSYVEALRREERISEGTELFSEIEGWEMVYWKPTRRGYRWTAIVEERAHLPPPTSRLLADRWCEWR